MLKDQDVKGQAFVRVWPEFKRQAIEAYWQEHKMEKFFFGGGGSHDFHMFKMLLDGHG